MRILFNRVAFCLLLCLTLSVSHAQEIKKVYFEPSDSTSGYYLAITPQSNNIKGVLVLLTSFYPPEYLLPETKLQNVAFTNEILMVTASMNQKLYADEMAVSRINRILQSIKQQFKIGESNLALAGYGEAGGIALRYTELTYEKPGDFPVQPKAVFGIDSPVDLFGLWHWSEEQIKKNYWQGAVGDAHYYIDNMTKENGTIYKSADKYKRLTPFYKEDSVGNERFLKDVSVRLYYDTDIEWQLKNRRNSLYDTKMADGSELIKRLMLAGNNKAEFVASKHPGLNTNGTRHPSAISIVDEVDCIQWLKKSLQIFDPASFVPPYKLSKPQGWETELFVLPPDFAPTIIYKGVEDIRFAPGWGDSTSEEHWSYAFLWWLDGKPEIDAETLQSSFRAYYEGLVGRNIVARKIPDNKLVPLHVTIKKVKTEEGDVETYGGVIHMLNYMMLKPIDLNAVVHVKKCDNKDHSAAFIEISPKPATHAVWQAMNNINKQFGCKAE